MAQPPFRLIYEGEWNDIVCVDYPLTKQKLLEEDMHPLLNTQVDAFTYNLCSSDGYCCELENGELLMRSVEKFDDAWAWRYRENIKKLIEAGANPPDIATEYGHLYGMKVFPVVRMNDPHDQYLFARFELSDFKRQHPEYLLGEDVDWEQSWIAHGEISPPGKYQPGTIDSITWGLFDYAHEAVRAHKLAIIEEFATRWDNDGVMLDFERDPCYFRDGTDPQNQQAMTELVRQVRATLDEVAAQRGREQYLIVRVLPDIDEAIRRGLDVRRWVEEDLVQVIVPGAGYAPLTLQIQPWLELVAGHNCWIFACSNHWRPLEETRAWALTMRRAGAHGVYLFNWGHLLYGHPAGTIPQAERTGTVWYDEVHPDYYQALYEIGDVRTMEYKDKRYVLDSIPHERSGEAGKLQREYRAIDDVVLPVTMSVGSHQIDFQFGDDLRSAQQHGLSPVVTLRLKINNYTAPDQFTAAVNGVALDNEARSTRAEFIMNNDTWVEYPVPPDLLSVGDNQLQIVVDALNPQMAAVPVLTNVEIVVAYS